MKNNGTFDYWEVRPKDQTAIMGEFKKTTSGFLISLIIFKWTNLQDQELTSFRISPKASLKIVAAESTSENFWIIRTNTNDDIRKDIAEMALQQNIAVLSMNKKELKLEEVFKELTLNKK